MYMQTHTPTLVQVHFDGPLPQGFHSIEAGVHVKWNEIMRFLEV